MILSIDDAFTAGAGLDVAGAYLLGRGLLAKYPMIVRRSGTYYGESWPAAASQIRDHVDAVAGVAVLLCGFGVQASGYVAELAANLRGGHGALEAVTAAAFAVAAVVVVVAVDRASLWARQRRAIIEYAHHDNTGRRHERPGLTPLLRLGMEFGHGMTGSEVRPGDAAGYPQRVFGVTELREDEVGEIFGPPRL